MFGKIKSCLRSLFRKSNVEQDLDEELRGHLDWQIEQNIRNGMDPESARDEARRAFGGVEQAKERSRDVRGLRWLDELGQDLCFGARMLVRSPGFTLIAVLTLGLGVGANTAIFSLVNTVLLNPLPYADPDRLMALWEVRKNGARGSLSYPNFVDLRAQNQVFEKIAVYRDVPMAMTGAGELVTLQAIIATPELFPLLNAKLMLGRFFLSEEEKAGHRVVVLSHPVWRKYFGADQKAVGKPIILDGKTFTVIGVTPAGFDFPVRPEQTDLWVSSGVTLERESPDEETMAEQRGAHLYDGIARLKPGVALGAARADLESIMARLRSLYPDDVDGDHAALQPYLNDLVGDVKAPLLALFGAVVMTLMIACANIASLLLARGSARRREFAVRRALGANGRRMIQQLLTESLLLASLGGLAALLLARWGLDWLKAISPVDMLRVREAGLDGRVLLFTAMVTLLTGLFFGLFPALRAARTNLNQALNEGGRGSGGPGRNRMRGSLVVAQTALAMTLLIGAGLLINSFARLLRVDPGFDPHHLLTFRVEPPKEAVAFNRDFLKRIESIPGVRSAAMGFKPPLSPTDASTSFEVDGQKGERRSAGLRIVTPSYFRTLGVPFVYGRDFIDHDGLDSPPVIIINETLAQFYFPNQNPIGKRLRPDLSVEGDPPWREIVAVVRAVRHRGLSKDYRSEIFLPSTQMPGISMTTVVRTVADPIAIIPALRDQLRAIDPDLPITQVRTLEQALDQSFVQPRFNMLLMTLFAALALTLTAVGLYGMLRYSVAQRAREIGVRIALGARASDVLRLVLAEGMTLALIGVALGLLASLALRRILKTMLFGVSPSDPLTFLIITVLLVAVALIACLIPARRATKIDPMIAMRAE